MLQNAGYRRVSAPGSLPLLGHVLKFRQPLEFVTDLSRYGDLVDVRLGRKNVVVVCNPQLVQDVLMDARTFDKGGPFWEKAKPFIGNGLATCSFADHRKQRRLLQPAFHQARLPGYAEIIGQQVSSVLREWREGQIIDAYEGMYEITARAVARTILSADLSDVEVYEIRELVAIFVDGWVKRMVAPVGTFDVLPTPANRRWKAAHRRLREIADRYIAEYRAAGVDHGDLLSMMMAAQDDEVGQLSDPELCDQVITILSGAPETSASLLAWIFYLLAENPHVEEALHRELDTVLAGRPVTWADLPRLDLTERIIIECLRISSPGWITSRITTRDVELGGHALPGGTNVIYSAYMIHHRDDIYPDPDRFDPDRWIDHKGATISSSGYVPFAAGARKCIGDKFAVIEVSLALAIIASEWKLELLPEFRKPRPAVRGVLSPGKVPMRLTRRSPQSPKTKTGRSSGGQ